MAKKYLNITADATNQVLITKGNAKGNIKLMRIVNTSTTLSTNINLNIYDDTNTYSLIQTILPPSSNLELDNISYDSNKYQLRLTTVTAGDATLTITY